jgi:hypothetical protein
MRLVAVLLAVSLAFAFPARARMGDSVQETTIRYGGPAGSTGQPGALTSTQTFFASGLKIVCGYVNKKVEMITYSRSDRAFIPSEVEAILRTNARKQGWTPSQGFTDGTYHTVGGRIATVTDYKIEIKSAKWVDALAKDKAAADKTAADKAAKAAQDAAATNTAP